MSYFKEAKAIESVQKIVEDIKDRRGLRQEWSQIDDDLKNKIKTKWTMIILNKFNGE